MRQIEVRIKAGVVTVTPKGFKGESCKDATKLIEKALGQTTSDTPTDEAYESPQQEHLTEGA